jgi:predicted unusual protein kinase regulating ubiquinone biosynthesis (AarF/ABC1/UbiB family)
MDLKLSNLRRYGSVTRLLLKYGRPDTGPVELPDELDAPPNQPESERGEALAADLEALGPTFIKLGQLLSSRGAFIPPEYSAALERLQDNVEPFSFGEVDAIVTEDLGVRISKAFQLFEPEPVASASLGQVHRAILRDGREVVVKVQRPNIRPRILEDLEAFDEIAKVLEKHTDFGEKMELRTVLEEFRRTILEELDYRREAENLQQLADNLREYRHIVVPRPVPDYSSSRVLTMEYIAGRKITKASPLTPLEVDGEELLEELFQAYLQQILVDGFFHADPHPGNVFLTDDNRIALLDLGMVARISPRMRDALLKMVLAIADGRGEDTADLALGTAEQRADVNAAEFRRRVVSMVSEYSGQGLGHRPIGQVFLDIVRAAVDSGVRLPPETAMIGKTLYNLEATARTLSPEFNPSESIRTNSAKLMRKRMLKSLSPENLFGGVLELREFVDRLPNRLNRIFDAAADNQLGLKVDTGIDAPRMMLGFQKVANRIATGLVLAALIVGAAMLMQVETSFRLLGYPGFAIILFLLAVAGGIAMVLTIVAHDRRDQRNAAGR